MAAGMEHCKLEIQNAPNITYRLDTVVNKKATKQINEGRGSTTIKTPCGNYLLFTMQCNKLTCDLPIKTRIQLDRDMTIKVSH